MKMNSGFEKLVVSIFLVDDDKELIESLKLMISDWDDVAVKGTAFSGKEAVSNVPRLKPDIVVMDMNMPEMNGIESSLILKDKDPEQRVILYCGSILPGNVHEVIQNRIEGVILKSCPSHELHYALKCVKTGEWYYCDTFLKAWAKDYLASF